MAKKSSLGQDDKEILEAVGVKICQVLREEFFEVSGTPTAVVKYKDGTFKNKPIGGLLFCPEYAYVSSRDILIFGFEPEGSQIWDHTEIPSEKMEVIFPDILARAKALLFKEEEAELIESWNDMITILFEGSKQERLKEKKSEKLKLEETYANHPLFGRF